MKRSPLFYLFGAIGAVLLWLLWSSLADAQDLTPVTSTNYTGIILLAGGGILLAGVLYLKFKNPELWAKITKQAGPALRDVEHTIGGVAANVGKAAQAAASQASTKLHEFEAHRAPIQAPALSPTPTSPGIHPDVPLEVASAPVTTEQFLSDEPLPPPAPRFVNGRMI